MQLHNGDYAASPWRSRSSTVMITHLHRGDYAASPWCLSGFTVAITGLHLVLWWYKNAYFVDTENTLSSCSQFASIINNLIDPIAYVIMFKMLNSNHSKNLNSHSKYSTGFHTVLYLREAGGHTLHLVDYAESDSVIMYTFQHCIYLPIKYISLQLEEHSLNACTHVFGEYARSSPTHLVPTLISCGQSNRYIPLLINVVWKQVSQIP